MNKTLQYFGLILFVIAAYISGVLSHPSSFFFESENDYISEANETKHEIKIDKSIQTNS